MFIMGYQSDITVTNSGREHCKNEGWLQDLLPVEEVVGGDAVQDIAFPYKSMMIINYWGGEGGSSYWLLTRWSPVWGVHWPLPHNIFKIEALGNRISGILRQVWVLCLFFF